MVNLDMDVLRTFAAGLSAGSFARAAGQVGRSQSAVSLQLRRLEAQLGQPLLRKQGRALVPTEAGDVLLGYARRILALNDAAVAALGGLHVAGSLRIGVPPDFAEHWLPRALALFAAAHPAAHVEARVDRNRVLLEAVAAGRLDLGLAWLEAPPSPESELVAHVPACWIGPPGFRHDPKAGPLPLALIDPPCLFRTAATAALDAASLPWRLSFTSPSLAGLFAAAEAGLGITARTAFAIPRGLVALAPETTGLPALPAIPLFLVPGPRNPAVDRFRDILRRQFASPDFAAA